MYEVSEIAAGLFLVTRNDTIEPDGTKLVRDLVRLPFGKPESDEHIVSFLREYAFGLPSRALSARTDSLIGLGLLEPDELGIDYPAPNGKICEEHGLASSTFIYYAGEIEAGYGAPFYAGLKSDTQALVSTERLEQLGESMRHLMRLAIASNQDLDEDRQRAASGKAEALDDYDSMECYEVHTDEPGEFTCSYSFFHVPDMTADTIKGPHSNPSTEELYDRAISLEGFTETRVLEMPWRFPYSSGRVLKVAFRLTPKDPLWESRRDETLLHRIAAGVLFRLATTSNDIRLHIDPKTKNVKASPRKGIESKLAGLFDEGRIRSCLWCGKPIINEQYCHFGRCRRHDNESAKHDKLKGMEPEEVIARHPGIKPRTIRYWY